MAHWPGLSSDFFFGSPSNPLPNWRKVAEQEESDRIKLGAEPPDDDEASPAERASVKAILGFDPDDLESLK